MSFLVEETEEGQKAFKSLLIKPENLAVLNTELAMKILKELSKEPSCVMDLARKLKQHEQKIYYHMRRLEKAGIVKLLRREERVGALAKIYSVPYPVVSVKISEDKFSLDVKTKAREIDFFKSFIENGKLDSTIVVGSPDPHGTYGLQASDGSCAIDFALFLGSFLKVNSGLNYKLDTELREKDLKDNLILIGGPKVNMIVEKVNSKLPVYFDFSQGTDIISSYTKTRYSGDDIGIIVKIKNPFNENRQILILSGKRFKGTRAAIIALIKHMKEIETGNKYNGNVARIVRGIDRNSDGIIDDVEFLE